MAKPSDIHITVTAEKAPAGIAREVRSALGALSYDPDEHRSELLAQAAEDAAFARSADDELRAALRAVTTLFGPTLADALHHKVERVTDSQDVAIGRHQEAAKIAEQRINELRAELADARERRFALERVLTAAAIEEERRAARTKSGTVRPWHSMATELLVGDPDALLAPEGSR